MLKIKARRINDESICELFLKGEKCFSYLYINWALTKNFQTSVLSRFFEREVNFGLKLLAAVRTDLDDVVAITSGGRVILKNVETMRSNLNAFITWQLLLIVSLQSEKVYNYIYSSFFYPLMTITDS